MRRILISLLLLAIIACAKEELKIGREDPEVEIQKCTRLAERRVYDRAVECLEIFKSRFYQTRWGQVAELKIADTHFRQKQYLLAAETYLAFVKLHPNHPEVDTAHFRSGLAYLNEAPHAIDRDQTHLFSAIGAFERVLRMFPDSAYRQAAAEKLEEAENRMAQRLFYVARFYYRTEEYIAATRRLGELAAKYPDYEETPKALYYKTRAHLALKEPEEARQAVETLVLQYPKNPWTKRAQDRYLKALD